MMFMYDVYALKTVGTLEKCPDMTGPGVRWSQCPSKAGFTVLQYLLSDGGRCGISSRPRAYGAGGRYCNAPRPSRNVMYMYCPSVCLSVRHV